MEIGDIEDVDQTLAAKRSGLGRSAKVGKLTQSSPMDGSEAVVGNEVMAGNKFLYPIQKEVSVTEVA